MKKLLLFCIAVCIVMLTSCVGSNTPIESCTPKNKTVPPAFQIAKKITTIQGDGEHSTTNNIYRVEPKIISYGNHSFIVYPYIYIFDDTEKEKQLNDHIKHYLFYSNNEIHPLFTYDEDRPLQTAAKVGIYLNYEITYTTDMFLSILFHGVYAPESVLSQDDDFNILEYVSNDKYVFDQYGISPAFTINIETGKEVVLGDILPMNKDFENEIRNRMFLSYANPQAINYDPLFDSDDPKYDKDAPENYNDLVEQILPHWQDFGKLTSPPIHHYSIFNGTNNLMLTEDDIYIIYNPTNLGYQESKYFYFVLQRLALEDRLMTHNLVYRVDFFDDDGSTFDRNYRASTSFTNRMEDLTISSALAKEGDYIYAPFEVHLPQFDGSENPIAIDNINTFFQEKFHQQKEAQVEYYNDLTIERAQTEYADHYFHMGYEILRNDEAVLSVMVIGRWGSRSRIPHPYVYNFDVKTGYIITLDDIFEIESKAYKPRICAQVDTFFDQLGFSNIIEKSSLQDCLEPENFVLNESSLTFIYQCPSLLSTAAGVQSIHLSFEVLGDVVNPKYLPVE